MTISIIAASVAVCAVSFDPLCGSSLPNLVVNGDFGTVDVSGWTLDCPEGACSVEPDSSGVGGQFRRTHGENPYTTLSQTLNLNPGRYALAYSIRDSTVLHSTTVPNELTVRLGRLGPVVDLYTFGQAEIHRYREFVSNAGSTELSFDWFTVYGGSDITQSMVLDDISVVQLDDTGAAQSAALFATAVHKSAQRFVETIFSAQGSGPIAVAARPVATQVAGPFMARSATTHAWMSGGYSQANWDDFDAEARESALSGGMETDAGDGWTAGFAGTVVDRDTGLTDSVSSVDSSGWSGSFAVYGAWAPVAQNYYLRATAGGGVSTREHVRQWLIGANSAIANDIDGAHFLAAVEAGYRLKPMAAVAVTPYARLTGVSAGEDRYFEIDAFGSGVTSVDSTTQDSLTSQIGFRGVIADLFGPQYALSLHGAWRHEFLDQDGIRAIYSDFSGASFAIVAPGLTRGRDTAVFGVGLEATLWDRTSFFARYDGEAGDGHSVHSGQFGLRTVW
jgi:hypothetical protein